MRITNRLLLPLLVTVAVVMMAFAVWALRQRERATIAEAERETNAYATALGLALEAAFRAGSDDDVQHAIDRISNEPTIYGVIVYGTDTGVLFTSQPVGIIESAPLAAVRQVIASREPRRFTREIDGERAYSVVRPLLARDGSVMGAMEVVQPLRSVLVEKNRTRIRFVLNTLTLLAALTLVITFLTRRLIAEPLDRFVHAVRALARGELGHRIRHVVGGSELSELADEFNRMAERLEAARAELELESEERVRLAGRLRETEKLAVVGNLAAGLAHEIAAPLHVIRGRAEMMRRRVREDAAERNLRIITDQIDRITTIVRSLLDYARRREPRIERVDAGKLLRDVAEFLEPELARAGVALDIRCPANASLLGDPDLLHQVFINLFMNAVQVMAGHEGERRITVDVVAGDAAAAEDASVSIHVRDTGPGLDPASAGRIFEPFFTTKAPGEGTGLGLAVVRSIVEEHGGTVAARNHEDGGACFTMSLPAVEHEPAAAHV